MQAASRHGLTGRLWQLYFGPAATSILSSRSTAPRFNRLLHTGIQEADGNVAPEEHSSASTEIAPTEQPLIYPDPPRSAKHCDLASFLQHAETASLDPKSTVYVGTHFEYTVATHLAPLGFDLRRVGGASDRGIDLLGVWSIPCDSWRASHAPIRVLLQCKAGAGQRIGPHLVRELEGAFIGAPAGWRSRPATDVLEAAVIGLLVAERPATKGIREALTRSRWPMAFMCISSTGHLKQMLWNQRAEQEGGFSSLGVTPCYSDEGAGASHLILNWEGRPLLPSPNTAA
ncbi:hypothetical protein CMQ_2537 [Grosmannia clavigera kw1407]|uniref:Uncharacterized protein n=1 Tax=Grosmannia clavigera (strain kw1407 / UAMH 11150) TaxID=655863 RepID=F0XI56_GROCL|nr:uncharacterized protein CMQ_2537 [Grosmannia clavigera kw1407]EFX02608.1 hypothetical protein CMQ_2537 [Grosmannia clavigera kw1407]